MMLLPPAPEAAEEAEEAVAKPAEAVEVPAATGDAIAVEDGTVEVMATVSSAPAAAASEVPETMPEAAPEETAATANLGPPEVRAPSEEETAEMRKAVEEWLHAWSSRTLSAAYLALRKVARESPRKVFESAPASAAARPLSARPGSARPGSARPRSTSLPADSQKTERALAGDNAASGLGAVDERPALLSQLVLVDEQARATYAAGLEQRICPPAWPRDGAHDDADDESFGHEPKPPRGAGTPQDWINKPNMYNGGGMHALPTPPAPKPAPNSAPGAVHGTPPADTTSGLTPAETHLNGWPLVWHTMRLSGVVSPNTSFKGSPSLTSRPSTSPGRLRRNQESHPESTYATPQRVRPRSSEAGVRLGKGEAVGSPPEPQQTADALLAPTSPQSSRASTAAELRRTAEQLAETLVEVRRKDEYAQKQLAMAMVRRATTGEDSYASPLLKKLTRAAAKMMGVNSAFTRRDRSAGVASKKIEMLRGMHACRSTELPFREAVAELGEPAQAVVRCSAQRRRLIRLKQALEEAHLRETDETKAEEAAETERRLQVLGATHRAAMARGDDAYREVIGELAALVACTAPPAEVREMGAAHGGLEHALSVAKEELLAKERELREASQAYDGASTRAVDAGKAWVDATVEYRQHKQEQQEVMAEEFELVRSAQAASWQKQLGEAELENLEHLRALDGEARSKSLDGDGERPESPSSPSTRLDEWNRKASERSVQNAELLEALEVARAEERAAAADTEEAAAGAMAAAQAAGGLREDVGRVVAFLATRPKSMTTTFERWIQRLLDAADELRVAKEEYAPLAPLPPPPASPSDKAPSPRPAEGEAPKTGGKKGWGAVRIGVRGGRGAPKLTGAAEKAAATALMKAAEDCAKAVEERIASEVAAAAVAKEEEARRRERETPEALALKAKAEAAAEELARLVSEARSARQGWEAETARLLDEEEALLAHFSIEKPKARRLSSSAADGAEAGGPALTAATGRPSVAPLYSWSADMERVERAPRPLDAMMPAAALLSEPMDEATDTASPGTALPALASPRSPAPPPASTKPRGSPPPRTGRRVTQGGDSAPFSVSPSPRSRGSFMDGTGASSARNVERSADSSWLNQSLGMPPPSISASRQRWLVREADREAEEPRLRPKVLPYGAKMLPELWTLHSPPRQNVVVTAGGGVASTSLSHSMRPVSARAAVRPPSSASLAAMRSGASLPPGCAWNLGLRAPGAPPAPGSREREALTELQAVLSNAKAEAKEEARLAAVRAVEEAERQQRELDRIAKVEAWKLQQQTAFGGL